MIHSLFLTLILGFGQSGHRLRYFKARWQNPWCCQDQISSFLLEHATLQQLPLNYISFTSKYAYLILVYLFYRDNCTLFLYASKFYFHKIFKQHHLLFSVYES